MAFYLFHANLVLATPWPAQKIREKEPNCQKYLNFNIPYKFQHSFLPNSISKQNKKNWTRNYTECSNNYYQKQYDLCRKDLSEILRKWSTTAENTYNWLFFISLSNAPCRSRLQSKMKTTGQLHNWAIPHVTLIISCFYSINNYLL